MLLSANKELQLNEASLAFVDSAHANCGKTNRGTPVIAFNFLGVKSLNFRVPTADFG